LRHSYIVYIRRGVGGASNCRENQYQDAPTLALPRYRKGGTKALIAFFEFEFSFED
jgi:hypothetical protein